MGLTHDEFIDSDDEIRPFKEEDSSDLDKALLDDNDNDNNDNNDEDHNDPRTKFAPVYVGTQPCKSNKKKQYDKKFGNLSRLFSSAASIKNKILK